MRKSYSEILKTLGPPPRPDIPLADRPNTPARTLWFRRPEPWINNNIVPTPAVVPGQILANKVSLHHDANEHSPGVVQPSTGGIEITAPSFDGSFLSVALGMTRGEVSDIHEHDIIRLTLSLHISKALRSYARLTMLSGPNHEKMPLELTELEGSHMVEWDLYFSNFNPLRAKDVWVDLIFEHPSDATIRIDDLYMLRHPRANF